MWDSAGDEAQGPPMPAVPDAPASSAPTTAESTPSPEATEDTPSPEATEDQSPEIASWPPTPSVLAPAPPEARPQIAPQTWREPEQIPPIATTPPPLFSPGSPPATPTPSRASGFGPVARPLEGVIPALAPAPIPSSSSPSAPATTGRRWPLLLLAFLTIAASGGVSWLVARNTAAVETAAVQPDVPADAEAIPAVANTVNPTPIETTAATSVVSDEPFADAAAKIAPSVVQLSLASGLGSGVIIDVDGTILTAAHVVGTNTEVDVRLYDGTIVSGTVLGTHEGTDVAVVSIDPEGLDLVAAPLADVDEVRVGQLAVAVGSPFGFTQSVTAGIISGVDRVVNNVSMVQTDAPINPGNSGGPLIDLQGRVVGINDLIFTESGSNAGVGFAISIDLATIVANQIIAGDEVQLARLGVQTSPTDDGRAGALIVDVFEDTAAAAAGLEVGDLVVGVDGRPTPGSTQLRAQVVDNPPGTVITLDVIRSSGERLSIEATLGSAG